MNKKEIDLWGWNHKYELDAWRAIENAKEKAMSQIEDIVITDIDYVGVDLSDKFAVAVVIIGVIGVIAIWKDPLKFFV